MQVGFLHNELSLAWEQIAEITRYTISTIKTYCSKFKNLLEQAKEIFSKRKQKGSYENRITWEVSPNNNPCAYALEFYNGGEYLWLKVGMTAQDLIERIKQHFKNYGKKYKELTCVVKNLYEVETPERAEMLESAMRECYKETDPHAFQRNDRFLGVKYNTLERSHLLFNQVLSIA